MRLRDQYCKCFTCILYYISEAFTVFYKNFTVFYKNFIHAEIVSPLIVIFVLFSVHFATMISTSKSD